MSIAAALIVLVLICTLLLASGTPPHGMRS
jgi:hypothetical protein